MASLRLVSPGAETDGVTLFTSRSDDLFSHRRHSDELQDLTDHNAFKRQLKTFLFERAFTT